MPTQHLADGELAVLKALWQLGPSPVRTVQELLAEQGQDLAYTTVQTVLSRLTAKELVDCDKSETPHRFRATVSRERFRKDRVRDVLHKVFDGAAGTFALQLVQQGKLTATEIDALQNVLDELVKGKKRRRR